LSPNATYMALTDSSYLKIYKRNSNNSFSPLNNQPVITGTIMSMAFSPDGKYFAAASTNLMKVYIWPLNTGNAANPLGTGFSVARPPGATTMPALAFSPDSQYMAVAGGGGTLLQNLAIYNVSNGMFGTTATIADPMNYSSSSAFIMSMSWSSDSNYLALTTTQMAAGYKIIILRRIGTTSFIVTSTGIQYSANTSGGDMAVFAH
jgi:WD40 repeat protein